MTLVEKCSFKSRRTVQRYCMKKKINLKRPMVIHCMHNCACSRSSSSSSSSTHPESLFVTGGCSCCWPINARRSVHPARRPVSSVLHRRPFRSGWWRWEMRELKRWMRGHGTWTHGTTAKRQGHSIGNQVPWTYLLEKAMVPILANFIWSNAQITM